MSRRAARAADCKLGQAENRDWGRGSFRHPHPLDKANSARMSARDAIYQEIINLARERLEDAWWRSDRQRVATEEAHLKLIPRLLRCGDERRHRHYLRIDRPRFVRACGAAATGKFEPFWADLEEIAKRHEAEAPAAAEVPLARLAGPARLGYRGPRGAHWPTG